MTFFDDEVGDFERLLDGFEFGLVGRAGVDGKERRRDAAFLHARNIVLVIRLALAESESFLEHPPRRVAVGVENDGAGEQAGVGRGS